MPTLIQENLDKSSQPAACLKYSQIGFLQRITVSSVEAGHRGNSAVGDEGSKHGYCEVMVGPPSLPELANIASLAGTAIISQLVHLVGNKTKSRQLPRVPNW